jgi:hypothetical protein
MTSPAPIGSPSQESGAAVAPPPPEAGRGALAGAMISGIFGLAWALWAASGLTGATAVAVRVAGIVAGVTVIAASARLRRSPAGASSAGSRSMLGSRPYLLIVGAEAAALIAGAAVLGVTHDSRYVPAWFAGVVGVHFLAFGHFFYTRFYLLGIALIAAGIAGAAVGIAGSGRHGIAATCGLIAAIALLAAGARTVLVARSYQRPRSS